LQSRCNLPVKFRTDYATFSRTDIAGSAVRWATAYPCPRTGISRLPWRRFAMYKSPRSFNRKLAVHSFFSRLHPRSNTITELSEDSEPKITMDAAPSNTVYNIV